MPATQERFDTYAFIHKALRAWMADTLVRLGRTDATDATDVDETLASLAALLQLCRDHVKHEDRHLHAAMEARRPGSAAATLHDHGHHVEAIDALERLAARVTWAPAPARAAALRVLYREFARFIADKLEHMNVEETANNAVLWATYTDAELREIDAAIVASVAPETIAIVARWMLPALTADERAGLLAGMQQAMPPAAFAGMLQLGRQVLSDRDWFKLQTRLSALRPVSAAA
jgi:hypothetical protein